MRFEVNINKKYAFIIIGLLAVLVVGVFGVYAVWSNPSSGMWHDDREVKISIAGTDYSLEEAIGTQIQRRVTGTCSGSNFVQTITDTGTVTCAAATGGGGTTIGLVVGGGIPQYSDGTFHACTFWGTAACNPGFQCPSGSTQRLSGNVVGADGLGKPIYICVRNN